MSYRPYWLVFVLVMVVIMPVMAQETVEQPANAIANGNVSLQKIANINTAGAEIIIHDADNELLFVIAGGNTVDLYDFSIASSPEFDMSLNISAYGASANSIAIKDGLIAVAVAANPVTNNGAVVFYNTSGVYQHHVTVGPNPDMVTFTPDGNRVLVANEGEPDGSDPAGSVSLIDISNGVANAVVTTADFSAYDNQRAALEDDSVYFYSNSLSVSQQLEPEYIATDGITAWVTLQENNALAVVDIVSGTVSGIVGLGFKDHNAASNAFDASDRDNGVNINNWPVYGMYQPDTIVAYDYMGQTYLVTANEGDPKGEDERIKDLTLDATAFPDAATLQADENLGRLEVSTARGDVGGDNDYDALYAFGARSFAIWDNTGTLVYESGSDFETIVAQYDAANYNGYNDADSRSDNRGPEPEGITLVKANNSVYAVIGLERVGGLMVYDVTFPQAVRFVQYVASTNGDDAPEGLTYIAPADSPNGQPLLVVGYETSKTLSVYQLAFDYPFDVDGDGLVTPVDAIYVINRLNTADATADMDGDGDVDVDDAISVVLRLGESMP